MRIRAFALGVVLVALFSVPAWSQEEDFGRPGWFVGGGLNFAVEEFDVDQVENFSGERVDVSNSIGFEARGGYRLNRWVAFEGNWQYYSGFDIEDRFGNEVLNLSAFSFFANAKGYPLDGRFQPYGLFGMGVLRAEVTDDFGFNINESDAVFAVKVGGGIDVYFTEHLLGYFDVNYLIGTSDMNFGGPADVGTNMVPMSWGVQWRF